MLRIYNLHMGKLYSRIPKSFYIVPYNEQYETGNTSGIFQQMYDKLYED